MSAFRTTVMKLLAVFATAAAVSATTAIPASASPPDDRADSAGSYLALGDSVAFGYNPLLDPRSGPAQYVGYPDLVARALHLRETNAACPGEATGGFTNRRSDNDNGCETGPTAWRTLFPLHVRYKTAQLNYAVKYLGKHPNTRLVTLDIGSNDLFHCQNVTADMCAGELSATLATVSSNLRTIYGAIRAVYRGPLVTLTYYSPNYADPALTGVVRAGNLAIASVATAAGGTVADGFTAFGAIAAQYGGSPCAAGLLIKKSDGTCDIHPTRYGQTVLAQAVTAAIPPLVAAADDEAATSDDEPGGAGE